MSDLCPVVVAKDSSTEDQYQPESAAESHLLLLKQKKYCDVTFTFPNLPDRVQAHEFCLKARSPVFAEIFRMRKSGNVQGNEIQIRDSSPEVFQQFLEFIYADKLEVDIAGALNLLQLAQEYKVHPLTKKCEDLLLLTKIPVQDSVQVYETACRYCHRELMDRASKIMVKSFRELVSTHNALAYAKEETLAYLLSYCDDISVKEVELFEIILKWGKMHLGPVAGVELLRDVLNDLIPKIRYTNMSPEEFTKVVVPTGLLTAEDTISVFSYLCGDEITRRDLKMKFNTTRRKVEDSEKSTGRLAIVPVLDLSGADAEDLVASSSSSRSKPSWISALSNDPGGFQTSASPRSVAERESVPKAVQLGSGDNRKYVDSASILRSRWQQIEDGWRGEQRFAPPRAPSEDFVQRRGGFQDDRRAVRDHGFGSDDFRDRNRRSNTVYRDQVDRGEINRGMDHTRESRLYNNLFIYVDNRDSDGYETSTYEVPYDSNW